ncbi:ubiquitin carboxyl-terminal hydrolase MINDY-3-like [Saccoglossus kowalevskii]|uniref:Ubiquitin carboxyl-terminal hydrolase MINDY n=1 Tax=Saccoglossus kowalevskii TaxID=10224 RepID=A0ABM0GT87_SACKO|nr:PREDICTED: protein FAM188A-like [Saccoglossus kowalevskii]
MASTSGEAEQDDSLNLLKDMLEITWGSTLKEEVFSRWAQGFVFSEDEVTALLQHEGGPCAVIAPVQSFILKNVLFSSENGDEWRHTEGDQIKELLICSLSEMLAMVGTDRYIVVVQGDKQHSVIENYTEEGAEAPPDHATFHSSLRLQQFDGIEEVHHALQSVYSMYTGYFGVILFLYSVLLTKGIENIRNEKEDPNEPLIDCTYGHGSQSLINLMLTGSSVSNVWDNEKEISGLKLKGITQQTSIGFLTLLEHLRYCEVGWYLKNPRYPIWLLGSETHLTVVFSKEISLVAQESPWSKARRIFNSYDPEDCGFIAGCLLGDVMRALELVSEPEYVKIMVNKLDPDEYGIVLLSGFMEEFFPNEPKSPYPDDFLIYHYNGLKRSSQSRKVVYIEGTTNIYDPSEIKCVTDSTPIKTCLQTKWPGIEVQWQDGITPSIN